MRLIAQAVAALLPFSNGCTAYDFVPATGATVWQYNGGCGGAFTESVVFGSQAYLLNPNGANVVLNAATGVAAGIFVAGVTPAIHGYVGYFLSNAIVSAVSAKTGKALWAFAGDGSVGLPPIVVDDYVVAASQDGTLYVIDGGTGKAAWSGKLGQSAVAADGGGGAAWFSCRCRIIRWWRMARLDEGQLRSALRGARGQCGLVVRFF